MQHLGKINLGHIKRTAQTCPALRLRGPRDSSKGSDRVAEGGLSHSYLALLTLLTKRDGPQKVLHLFQTKVMGDCSYNQ